MKKRLLALLLAALMVVSLVPMMVFATGTTYDITNGSPAADKDKNGGYITVAESAAEGEKVEVTVAPNNGYRLKCLTYVLDPKTVSDILPEGFPTAESDTSGVPESAWKTLMLDQMCYVSYDGEKLFFYSDAGDPDKSFSINTDAVVSVDKDGNYVYTNEDTVTVTFSMAGEGGTLNSVTFANTANTTWDGTYQESACVAAGTMITMYNGEQKKVEDIKIGDVIRTFDHEKGEISSAPVCFIWESKNAANAFSLTYEGGIEVTVIEEHGFYDCEENKYVFINAKNAKEYIGDHFYNADTNSWLALKNCEALNESIDAYAIITSGHLNHMSNGMLSMCDGTVKVLANIFEYDNQMKFDADKKKADIEAYGLTPKEKILELEGFIESDYDDYNLQYLNVAIGKGLTTWEWIEAFSDYCVENGLVDIYSGSETAEKNEAPKMLLTSATAPKTLLGSTPEPTPQDGIEIKANENGTYTFIMPGYAVTVTAEFEEKAITIADILPDDFPTSYETAWITEQGLYTCRLDSSNLRFYIDGGGYIAATTAPVTPSGDDYVYTDEDGSVTFNMENGKLTSITVMVNGDDNTYVYALRFGVTVMGGNYVKGYFVDKGTAYSVSGNTLTVGDKTDTAGAIEGKEFDCWKIGETPVTEDGTITEDTIFTAVYKAAHTHAFTYTANNGKITATCTAGCDKGYDTTPLTLTLTAPASLVYDGNAKAFTFADGEADAWTGAGLELPKIYYYEKKDYPFHTGIDSAPTDAGGDYMVEITVNEKNARIYFTIDKATPYIKTNPEPTDIVYGKKLSDSTLFGGYVQVSSTNTTQVGGLFEWKLGDTIPALSDSETTEYDVTFTPADTNNYNTVSCKVKIKVTHTHNPVKVTGQAATETAAGWKDYYKCDCGALFEDENGTTPIENLTNWKAQGGYIPKLEKEPTAATLDLQIGDKEYYGITGNQTIEVKSLDDIKHIKVLVQNGVDVEGMSDNWSMSTDYLDGEGRGVLEVQVFEEGDDYVIFNLVSHYADCPGANVDDFQVMMITAKLPAPDKFTVTFNMNDHGTEIAKQVIESGNKVTKPADPTADGYTFDGWYADATFSVKFDFNSAVTKDTTVYAKWAKNSVTPTDPKSPQTGDNSHMALWLILMALSSMGLCACLIFSKKNEKINR